MSFGGTRLLTFGYQRSRAFEASSMRSMLLQQRELPVPIGEYSIFDEYSRLCVTSLAARTRDSK
jgi:hypothetical protein